MLVLQREDESGGGCYGSGGDLGVESEDADADADTDCAMVELFSIMVEDLEESEGEVAD